MSRSVIVEAGRLRYVQSVSVGSHLLQGDEPVSLGGSDVGPNPYEVLLAALGTCTSITVVCMPTGSSGRSKAYRLNCHAPESMLKTVLHAT